MLEAPERSGALNTACHAADQGRDIFVVMGNLDSPNCSGSNGLLQQNARPVLTGWDVVQEYAGLYPEGVTCVTPERSQLLRVAQEPVCPQYEREPGKKSIDNCAKSQYSVEDNAHNFTDDEKAVLEHLTAQPQLVDKLIADMEMPAAKVLVALTSLKMKGIVKNHSGNRVSK